MARDGFGYTKFAAEETARNKQRIALINTEVAKRVSDIEKELGLVFKVVKPAEQYQVYIGEQRGKEIRIGGALADNIKKIIIIDTVLNNVIYSGNFTEPAENYIKILKVYNARVNKQSGFRMRQ